MGNLSRNILSISSIFALVILGLIFNINFVSAVTPISLTSPNGGEVWAPGSTQTITWSGGSGNVGIYLYESGTTSAGYGNPALIISTNSIAAESGSYSWSISGSLTEGLYFIRLTDATSGDNSNADFTIGTEALPPSPPTVITPNGGETLKRGSNYLITWGNPSNAQKITIDLYKGGVWQQGIVAISVSEGLPAPTLYSWTVNPKTSTGSVLGDGSDYKIRVRHTEGTEFDDSDANFSIETTNPLTVTVPNGGEELERGSIYLIRWQNPSNTRQVTIDLYKGGVWQQGIVGISVANNLAAPTSYSWIVDPKTSAGQSLSDGSDYKIRVRATNGAAYDDGNGNFSIKSKTELPNIDVINLSVDSVTESSATLSWKTNIASDSQFRYAVDLNKLQSAVWQVSQFYTPDRFTHSATITGLENNTWYAFEVRSTNAQAGVTVPAYGSFTTGSNSLGNINIINLNISDITQNSAKISWQSSAAGDTQLRLAKSSSGLASAQWQVYGLAIKTDHNLTLSNLEPGTNYWIEARTTNASVGNSIGKIGSFSTKTGISSDDINGSDDLSNSNDSFSDIKPGWLVKNRRFAEVFYVNSNFILHWIINEGVAEKLFGLEWAKSIKEFDNLENSGFQFGDKIDNPEHFTLDDEDDQKDLGYSVIQPGWLVKNRRFAEVFYVDNDLALRWIINEAAAEKFFGSAWNKDIKEYDDLTSLGVKFGQRLE